jgi:hypothetical protein
MRPLQVSKRRRFKQPQSLKVRLALFTKHARAKASKLPPGAERDVMLEKVRVAGVAARIEEWLSSPGLRPPK